MELKKIDENSKGQKFYNKTHIFEYLVIQIISEFSDLKVIKSEDSLTELEVTINDFSQNAIITYLPGAVMIDSNSSLTLYLKHYVRPFDRKFFTVTETQKFSNLLYLDKIDGLKACIKSEFIRQTTVFHSLSKFLLAEILSFLDRKNLFRTMTLCKELKKIVDNPEIWRAIYYSKFGDCQLKLANLDWKSICVQKFSEKKIANC